ncbi:MAG: type III secretion system inner membrane ring subunit SctD [Opitutaceae bacterium]|nr:type III secretion system inner membrane ring subunit SctD [Opitutaceae bacterium]
MSTMSASGDWLLKIISGPHQGAEVLLKPGRLVVGSHPDCDLVLHDVLVAAQHFALTLEKGVLTVEPLEGRVFTQGKRVEARGTVREFGFVTAGTTHLVLGPAAARWPLLSAADVPVLEKEPVAAPAEAKPPAAAAVPGAADKTAAATGASPKGPSPEQRRRAWYVAGFGGVMLLVWLALWFYWAPPPVPPPTPAVRERAELALRSRPEGQSLTLEEQGGTWVVSGYVDSEVAYRELSTALRLEAPEVSQRFWSTPRLLESARAFLAERKLTLDATAEGPGELRIQGTVRSAAEWSRIRQLLLAEIPGLQRIRDDVLYTAATSAPALRVESTAALPRVMAGEPAATPTVVGLKDLGDGQGWIRLSDGAVLFRGARLPDGTRLVAVRGEQALLEKGGATYAVTLGAEFNPAQWKAIPATPAADPAPPSDRPVAASERSPTPNG